MMKRFLCTLLLPAFLLITAWIQPAVQKSTMGRGQIVYKTYCLSCHMDNGMGVPRMTPTLVKSKYVLGTKTKMIKIVLLGSDEFLEEERVYKNTMAPILNLTDQQLADVLTYIRNSYGNKASAISVGDVKYVKTRMK